jgi:hypothetical protein
MRKNKQRIRCSDKEFLEAVYSSKTYKEISDKTGQKIPTTIARYNRMKSSLEKQNQFLPSMERKKNTRNIKDLPFISKKIRQLKEIYYN